VETNKETTEAEDPIEENQGGEDEHSPVTPEAEGKPYKPSE